MRRLLVVYNPRSTKFAETKREVLAKVRALKGWMVGKFEVQATDVDANAAALARVIGDGDLVVAAGGDATATIAMNGVMLTKAREVRFGALSFGNFNDIGSTLRTSSLEEILEGEVREIWPLECLVDGEHFRWGMCYFTLGLFAESCAIFDDDKVRERLRRKRKSLLFSLWSLARWYMKNRRRDFLEDFELFREGEESKKCVQKTDYVAMNGRRMARVMRGGEWFLNETKFLSTTGDLRKFSGLFKVMVPSVFTRVPGEETTSDKLSFARPSKVMIQAEGEYKTLEDVREVEIRKATRPIRVVMG